MSETKMVLCGCGHCTRQRAAELGLGGPPWDAAAWALIAPQPDPAGDDPVKSDPQVLAATVERDLARAEWEQFNEVWRQAVDARRVAKSAERPDPQGGTALVVDERGVGRLKTAQDMAREADLDRVVDDAQVRRERAWRRVVEANEAIRAAQAVVRQRVDSGGGVR